MNARMKCVANEIESPIDLNSDSVRSVLVGTTPATDFWYLLSTARFRIWSSSDGGSSVVRSRCDMVDDSRRDERSTGVNLGLSELNFATREHITSKSICGESASFFILIFDRKNSDISEVIAMNIFVDMVGAG